MFEDLVGKRVVILSDRFMYRGRVAQELGPLLVLEDAAHVIDHGTDAIREEIPIGRAFVNVERAEAFWEEQGTLWIPHAANAGESAKKGMRAS
jgi:hypothetical protein